MKTAITPTRKENYPEWFQQVIKVAELAEHSPVRGCMVMRPWGYALWENIQRILGRKFKKTGVDNAYFPLFIPLRYLEKEATHVQGFAKECAVVTHSKLIEKEGKLIPDAELEEPLIVRPTSETIIGEMFAKWITSYRDLPLRINQWANVVRWEMRTRLFLRTTEFLWQEGHTAHASEEEAREETALRLEQYATFANEVLAIPVVEGEKTESERFPGAVATYTIEGMMQDGKALQGGTSHFLGQNFAKAAGITFRDADGNEKSVWTTSWGFSTRMIGALIMAHSDDDGLVLPPRIASKHVVIIPIVHKEEVKEEVMAYCKELQEELEKLDYHGDPLSVELDARDMRGGEKVWHWVKKGVPIRIEIGPRDIAEDALAVTKRNKAHRAFEKQSRKTLIDTVVQQLDAIQEDIYTKALQFREQNSKWIDTKEEFYDFFKKKDGFVYTHFCHRDDVEQKLKEDLSVTIRCIPFSEKEEEGICPFTGEKSRKRVLFSKAY